MATRLITFVTSTNATTRKVTAVPATSKGTAGDLAGDFIYDGGFLYRCVQDYSATTTWVIVANESKSGTVDGSEIVIDSVLYPLPSFLSPTVIPKDPAITSYDLGEWTISGLGDYASDGTWVGLTQLGDSEGVATSTTILVEENKASVSGNTYTLTRTNAPDIWIRETVTW